MVTCTTACAWINLACDQNGFSVFYNNLTTFKAIQATTRFLNLSYVQLRLNDGVRSPSNKGTPCPASRKVSDLNTCPLQRPCVDPVFEDDVYALVAEDDYYFLNACYFGYNPTIDNNCNRTKVGFTTICPCVDIPPASPPPTKNPTSRPTSSFPTPSPSVMVRPQKLPTRTPTQWPTAAPSPRTARPTRAPTGTPTQWPSAVPSSRSARPTRAPTTFPPTLQPSPNPTRRLVPQQQQQVEVAPEVTRTHEEGATDLEQASAQKLAQAVGSTAVHNVVVF